MPDGSNRRWGDDQEIRQEAAHATANLLKPERFRLRFPFADVAPLPKPLQVEGVVPLPLGAVKVARLVSDLCPSSTPTTRRRVE
jgi:hypothetical protein